MGDAPGKVRVLVVGAAAEDDGITVGELAVLLAEFDDLGRTDQGEVLRVGVNNQPLPSVVLRADGLEFFSLLDADGGFEAVLRKLVSNGKHGHLSLLSFLIWTMSRSGRRLTARENFFRPCAAFPCERRA